MDLFTHFIVPFILLFFLKSKYKMEGAFGGISVDFDFLIIFVGIMFPQLFVFTHRGITHSFIFGFVSAVIFLFIITRIPVQKTIGRIIKRDLNLTFTYKTILIAYFGVLIHLLLDFLTTGGIPLLYPFSLARFSGEIYYYTDAITTLAALVVLGCIYFKIDHRYKKLAMILFMVLLISMGGIRAYEKNNALNSFESEIEENFIQASAYPTSDMFTWNVVLRSSDNQRYALYEYQGRNGEKIFQGNYSALTIKNGTYDSAIVAINIADQLSVVENFKWRSFYTCIEASYDDGQWKLTYFDIVGSYATRNNLTVYIDN